MVPNNRTKQRAAALACALFGRQDELPFARAVCYQEVVVSEDCETYRLPTESEWEYAAQAGSPFGWSCGESNACIDSVVSWYNDATGKRNPHSCEGLAWRCTNEWGHYNLGGHFEWVADHFVTDGNGDPRARALR